MELSKFPLDEQICTMEIASCELFHVTLFHLDPNANCFQRNLYGMIYVFVFCPFITSEAKLETPLIAAFLTASFILFPVSVFANLMAVGTIFFAP